MIASFDIGIMPLPDDDWEKGKCAYKLIQYMACGLPVVASSVGMNREVVNEGWNGFLANNFKEWCNALELLIQDEGLRKRLGQNGRKLVEENYTLESNFQLMQRVVDANYHG